MDTSSSDTPIMRRLRWLEAENRRLRDLVAALRRDRMECHHIIREEARRCSHP